MDCLSILYQSLGRSKDIILSVVVLGVLFNIPHRNLGGCWDVCDADHTMVDKYLSPVAGEVIRHQSQRSGSKYSSGITTHNLEWLVGYQPH